MHQTFVYRSRHNSNALRSHVPFTYIATELKLGRALIRPPSRWLAHTSAHAHYTTIDTYETFFSLPFQMIQTQCAPIFLSMRNRNGCVQVYSDVTQFYLCNPILCARNNLYWSLDSQKCINCKHFINKKNYSNNIFYIYHEINCIRWIKQFYRRKSPWCSSCLYSRSDFQLKLSNTSHWLRRIMYFISRTKI